MNTGQIHYRFTGADLMLEILAQAPIPAQPSACSLHHPPARNHHKPLGVRGPMGDFQPPPARVLNPTYDSLIAALSPQELQAAPAIVDIALNARKELRQEEFAPRAIGHAGTVHHYQHEQSQDIDHDMAF